MLRVQGPVWYILLMPPMFLNIKDIGKGTGENTFFTLVTVFNDFFKDSMKRLILKFDLKHFVMTKHQMS